MFSRKAPYYPNEVLTERTTRYGMIITENIQLYESPIRDKIIYKYDLLDALSSIWGENIVKGHDYVWKIVSGDVDSDKLYKRIIAHSYRRFSAFANYIDDIYFFGDPTISLHERIISDSKALIDERRKTIIECGKYIGEDHGYLYLVVPKGSAPAFTEGVVKQIC